MKKSAYSQIELATSPLEFVHNGANIDQQNIIWANYLGVEDNHRLYQYYSERTFWLYEPEEDSNMMHRLQNPR
jgi:hypothetical protein